MREIEQSILGRAPEHDLEPSLDRIAAVMNLLGDPQHAFPVIHVTGTNGKTSTTRMIERMLREMGLSTGRFTSPHLHNIRERIALNGNAIDAERFVASYEDVLPFIEMVDARSASDGAPRMTYFEVLVAVAYATFADAPVDVAIVEVGMGGSWDATNVVDAKVAVVTPIAVDHERFLGSSLEGIATEKSGIVKPGSVMVSGLQEPDVAQILLERAREVGATPAFEGNEFGILRRELAVGGQQLAIRGLGGDYDDLFLPLHGPHQGHNAAIALAAVEAFVGGGEHRLDIDVIRAGLAGASSPGRLEIVRRSPTVLVDARTDGLPLPLLLPDAVATAVFRVVQEALGNVEKHAEARHVALHIRHDSAGLQLELRDDGKGFDVQASQRQVREGLGLTHMRERIETLGGQFSLQSAPGATVLTANLPPEALQL